MAAEKTTSRNERIAELAKKIDRDVYGYGIELTNHLEIKRLWKCVDETRAMVKELASLAKSGA